MDLVMDLFIQYVNKSLKLSIICYDKSSKKKCYDKQGNYQFNGYEYGYEPQNPMDMRNYIDFPCYIDLYLRKIQKKKNMRVLTNLFFKDR